MQAPVCEICEEMENDGGNDGQGIYDFVSVDCEAFGNRLYSVFSPNRKHSLSPSDSSTTTNSNSSQSPNNDNIMAAATTKQALNFIIQNHQDLVNRHNICLNHLRDATREVDALRRENTSLQILNRELNDRLSLMIQSNIPARSLSPNFQEISLMQGFGAMSIGDTASGRDGFVESPSPTSVMESNVMEMPMEPVRVALPKSISVRSDGYLKTNPVSVRSGGPAAGADCRPRNTIRVQSADPAAGKQKVYVQGGKKEGNAVELEVYNQGMLKTELCNKWQETGACPYGDHCQFAHGIEELRPVLRHPRYKTEVCRMVLAGDPCPYGHRCHFRHALTEQEKKMMMMSPGPDEQGLRI